MIYCMCFLAIFWSAVFNPINPRIRWRVIFARGSENFYLKGFWENSCFQDLWFLRCIYNLWNQHLKYPLISIPRLSKFELLITVDREIISNWTFHQLFFLKRGNCGRQQFDWSRNNSWWRALTRKKMQYIWHILVS